MHAFGTRLVLSTRLPTLTARPGQSSLVLIPSAVAPPHPHARTRKPIPAIPVIILLIRDKLKHILRTHGGPNTAKPLIHRCLRRIRGEKIIQRKREPIAQTIDAGSDEIRRRGVLLNAVVAGHVEVVVHGGHVGDVGEVGHGLGLDSGERVVETRELLWVVVVAGEDELVVV